MPHFLVIEAPAFRDWAIRPNLVFLLWAVYDRPN